MARLTSHGIVVDPPAGWDAQIYRRPVEPLGLAGQVVRAAPETPMPILHLANFALPAQRGDYGGGAVEDMRSGGVFVSILQHDPRDVVAPLFSGGTRPWPLRADDFDPNARPRRIGNQAGHQSFFVAAGRPYCLYAVIGSVARGAELTRVVNQALGSVSFV